MGLTVANGDSGAGNVKHDIAQFMRTLFKAGEGVAAAPNDPKAGFAARLSGLITGASNGTVPAALQEAFDALATHFQAPSVPAPAASEPVVAETPAADPVAEPVPMPSDTTAGAAPASVDVAVADAVNAAVVDTLDDAIPSTPSTPATSTFTLQALLSRLQQGLGYGATGASSGVAVGNTLSVTA